MGIGAGDARIDVNAKRCGGGRDDQAHARYGGRLGPRPTDRRDGRARRPGQGRAAAGSAVLGLAETGIAAAAGSAGMSAVSAARSAYVRAASARPVRAASSFFVSRPATNAVFSATVPASPCSARKVSAAEDSMYCGQAAPAHHDAMMI